MATLALTPGQQYEYVGNDRALTGIIIGVLQTWLFSQTLLNIAPVVADDLSVASGVMNVATSITTLFTGIFIVVMGGLADRFGRVRMIQIGFVLSILGSLLIGFAPAGGMAAGVLIAGRILQGFGGACVLPSTLALIKTYWQAEQRQRAISMWGIASFGGSGMASLFGGVFAENFGWRTIFFLGAASAVLGMMLVATIPESKAELTGTYKFDLPGVLAFMLMMVSLQVVATQGSALGWVSPATFGLLALFVVATFAFVRIERGNPHAFVDFRLFRNRVYTGATISNMLLNMCAGLLLVTMLLVQRGGDMTAQEAGLLTIGYGLALVAFIRVGEKLLQRFGPRKPMIWGSLIVAVSVVFLLPTNVMVDTYKILAVIGFTLLGLGLAFYATPATDAALSSLPPDRTGCGSGIYKMASSLGASFGIAISSAIFTALSADDGSVRWITGVISYVGRQDNLAIREAGFFALAINLVWLALAIVIINRSVPDKKQRT